VTPVPLEDVFLAAAALFVVLAIAMFYRAIVGPTTQDRLLAVNVLGTNTVVILALRSRGARSGVVPRRGVDLRVVELPDVDRDLEVHRRAR